MNKEAGIHDMIPPTPTFHKWVLDYTLRGYINDGLRPPIESILLIWVTVSKSSKTNT